MTKYTMRFQRYMLIFLVVLYFSSLFHDRVVANNASIPSLKQDGVQCRDHEKAALLQFKQSFLIDCDASTPPFAFPKVKSWEEDADCCTWDGVHCNEDTNSVIGLNLSSSCLSGTFPSNSTLFSLNHLADLNLADNDFQHSPIPSSISRLFRLSSLNLSESHFGGVVPSEISSLSSLSILDLRNHGSPTASDPYSLAFGDLSLDTLVTNLTRLTQLYLDFVDISSSVMPPMLSNMTSLTALSLSGCQLYGHVPQGIFHLPHLEVLVLYDNQGLVGQLPEFHPNSPLGVLDLRETELSGEIPSSIGNLVRLKNFAIDDCSFYGHVPSSLGNLTKLTVLGLSINDFNGVMPSSLTNLTNLESLSLSWLEVNPVLVDSWFRKLNKLTLLFLNHMNMGMKIPSNVANLTRLQHLNLDYNQLSGKLPQRLGNLTELTDLGLGTNQLEGPVQPWLSKLVNIQTLDLSHTKSIGTFEQFFELPNLQNLYLNDLNLTFLPSAITNKSSISKLSVLSLGLCNLSEFPQSLEYQNELQYLYLARNRLRGHVPQWFVDTTKESLVYLNISCNSLVGFEHPQVFLPWTNLEFLDLRGNMFQGPLPIPLKTLQDYDISDNHIYGAIPMQICLASSLKVLDLSNNSISGRIPPCISHLLGSTLKILNLRGNRFNGTIPGMFHKSCSLKMINLSDNRLEGRLPRSLANCTMLEVLDIGKNQVNDTFPSWLGDLPALQVLVLRHNHFHGKIIDESKSGQAFGRLRIIDLSHNFQEGPLPSNYLQRWHGMQSTSGDQASSSNTRITISYLQSGDLFFVSLVFNYEITITNKGRETLFPRLLTVFRVVDFSSNNFTGEIPSALGDLRGLQALNLSNNNLEGNIPSSLSKINGLQSLDLSRNMLSGGIPQPLNKLTFLEIFNVSHNHLVGPIPQGKQFDTFDNTSFDDNMALCGGQLSKKCEKVLSPGGLSPQEETNDEDGEDSDWVDWIIRALGCASGFIVGTVIGKLYITDRHHDWFMKNFGNNDKLKTRRRRGSHQARLSLTRSSLTICISALIFVF